MLGNLVDPAIFVDIVTLVPHGVGVKVRLRAALGSIRWSKEAQFSVIHCVHAFRPVPPIMDVAELGPVGRSEVITNVLVSLVAQFKEEQLFRWDLVSALADFIVQIL